jgi:hypothetical protein
MSELFRESEALKKDSKARLATDLFLKKYDFMFKHLYSLQR